MHNIFFGYIFCLCIKGVLFYVHLLNTFQIDWRNVYFDTAYLILNFDICMNSSYWKSDWKIIFDYFCFQKMYHVQMEFPPVSNDYDMCIWISLYAYGFPIYVIMLLIQHFLTPQVCLFRLSDHVYWRVPSFEKVVQS